MDWIIPGTTLTARREDAQFIEQQFKAMFFAGGMVLSQVAGITGLEPYTIQNWVKRGFLTKPVGKRYTLRQLCRILNINMFKSVMPLEQVCRLLSYVNGQLDDESDDMIDDSVLYFLFVRLASHFSVMHNPQGRDDYLEEVLRDYAEPVPGARERVEKVLRIMLTAWAASQLRSLSEEMTKALDEA
jgi:DNA-binding transcriptional MerR regulator